MEGHGDAGLSEGAVISGVGVVGHGLAVLHQVSFGGVGPGCDGHGERVDSGHAGREDAGNVTVGAPDVRVRVAENERVTGVVYVMRLVEIGKERNG